MPQKSLAESAALEAFEEAGVLGETRSKALGTYYYLKERRDGGALPCSVDVFAMQVSAQSTDWPDKSRRSQLWLPIDQAAAKLAEPGLREILRNFANQRRRSTHLAR